MTSISPGVIVVCDLDGCLIPFDGEWEKRLIERIKEFLDLHPESEFRVLSRVRVQGAVQSGRRSRCDCRYRTR